jgi:hypothetical protein
MNISQIWRSLKDIEAEYRVWSAEERTKEISIKKKIPIKQGHFYARNDFLDDIIVIDYRIIPYHEAIDDIQYYIISCILNYRKEGFYNPASAYSHITTIIESIPETDGGFCVKIVSENAEVVHPFSPTYPLSEDEMAFLEGYRDDYFDIYDPYPR